MTYAQRLVPRSGWGAKPAKASTYQPIDGCDLTVHWEGPYMGIAGDTHDRCPVRVLGIQSYHLGTGQFSDIAYNWMACQHGAIYEARGEDVLTGANGYSDANWASKSVCYLGGERDPFTSEAQAALRDLGAYLLARGGTSERWCHQDWVSTACPGSPICQWVKAPGSWSATTPEPTKPTSGRRVIPMELELRKHPDGRVVEFPAGFAGVPWGSVVYDGAVPKGASVVTHSRHPDVGTYSCALIVNGVALPATEASWGRVASWVVEEDAFVTLVANAPAGRIFATFG